MKKSVVIGLFAALIVLFSFASVSALFLGITDGYVKNVTGGIVSGATVVASVSGCSGGVSNGCTGTGSSDSNGYYIVNNLNLPKNGGVSVNANKSGGIGSNSGTADSSQVAHVNVTICYAPSNPSLTAVPDSHNTTVSLSWTSGVDPYLFSTTDDLDFDSVITNSVTSPISKIGLNYTTHTWQIRTCNSWCCSSWVSDTFVTTNSAPSAPTGTNFSGDNVTTSLIWISGVDPESDPTYDEVSYQNGTTISNPATSPLNLTTAQLIKWRVRTCDSLGACSSWVDVDTVTGVCISTTCPECPVCTGGGGGGGGGGSTGATNLALAEAMAAERRAVALYCNGIPFANTTLLKLDLLFDKDSKKLSIYGIGTTLEGLEYCPWCYSGVKDYDETGVDCGGSCRSCTQVEAPEAGSVFKSIEFIAAVVSLVILVIYILYKSGLIGRLFLGRYHYGI